MNWNLNVLHVLPQEFSKKNIVYYNVLVITIKTIIKFVINVMILVLHVMAQVILNA